MSIPIGHSTTLTKIKFYEKCIAVYQIQRPPIGDMLRNSEPIAIFKSRLLSFIRPVQSNIYHIFDPKGSKFLTRLGLGLSHLNEHKFRHNFQNCLNPLCSCSWEIEDTSH